MGIRSLSSYVAVTVPNTLQRHELRDTILIIDGSNLAYFLYLHCTGINVVFGGDYDKYSRFIEKFFEGLKECNVQCIVVLDGGQPLNGKKVKTVQDRLRAQISVNLSLRPSKQFDCKVFPPLGRQVFVTTLRSMGIPVLQTDFEADREIAILASKLGGTILSNDSDFFVCDVPNIRLEDLKFKKLSSKVDKKTGKPYKFYQCRRFNKQQFCQLSGIKRELLPALGPLLSNDYIELFVLRDFYSHLSVNRNQKFKRDLPESHRRVKDVLNFLKRFPDSTPEDIVQKVSTKFIASPRLRSMMMESLSDYKDFHTFETNLLNAIPAEIASRLTICNLDGAPQKKESLTTDLRLKDGRHPPPWFIENYRSVRIPHEVSDILTQGYFISPPHVEVEQRPSAYLVVEHIIQSVFSFLWKGVDWEAEYEEVDLEQEFTFLGAVDNNDEDSQMEEENAVEEDSNQTQGRKKKGKKRKHQNTQENVPKKLKSTPQNAVKKKRRRIRWFIRRYRDLAIKSVPVLPEDQVAKLPSLTDVESMSLEERKNAFYKLMNIKSWYKSDDLPDDLELILNFITYWMKMCSAELKNIHAQAILVCIFQYYIIDGKIGRVRTKKELQHADKAKEKVQKLVGEEDYAKSNATVKQLLSSMSNEECLVAARDLFNFHHLQENFKNGDYNKETVHSFSEYQVCVYFMQLVNSVLCFPFPQMSIEFLWGGTFSYNILQELKRTHTPLDHVREILGMGTCLERLYVKLYNMLCRKHPLPKHQVSQKVRLKSQGKFQPKPRGDPTEAVLAPSKEYKPTLLSRLDQRFEGLEIDC